MIKQRRSRKSANSLELTQLCNHRFWLKAKGGTNVVNGWVTFASDEKLALEVHGESRLKEGDEAICSVAHPTCTAQFIVEIMSVLPRSMVVRPHGVMHVPQRGEDPRRKTSHDIQILSQAGELNARVVDVSLGGLGLVVTKPIEPNSEVECELVRDGHATIALQGRIAYCRKGNDATEFRIGITLGRLARLDTARWKLFVREGDTIVIRRRIPA